MSAKTIGGAIDGHVIIDDKSYHIHFLSAKSISHQSIKFIGKATKQEVPVISQPNFGQGRLSVFDLVY